MNRTDALAMWRRVAADELCTASYPPDLEDVRLCEWIRGVAQALIETEQIDDPDRRKAAVQAAVGLAGKHDGRSELRALVNEVLWDFFPVGADGGGHDLTRSETVRRIVDEARRRSLLKGMYEFDDKKARELVRDLWTKRV